jgi:hypothetical protein
MIISPDPSHLLLCRPLLTSGQPISLHTHGLGWVVILLSGLCMLIWAVSPQRFLLYCFARDRWIGCPLCRRPDTSRSLLKVKTSVHSSSKSEKMCQKLCYNGESLHPHFIVERIQAYTDFFCCICTNPLFPICVTLLDVENARLHDGLCFMAPLNAIFYSIY